jgi:hypothetical protein
MNSKGPSHVDLDLAEPASSRRGLLGAAGAAGLLGGVAVLLSDGPAGAAPNVPTEEDTALLGAAQALELSATDLYQLALDAGIDDPSGAIDVMARNHRAYAEAIAGATGISANARNDEVYDSLADQFDTTDLGQFAAAGVELENTAVATHTELLGMYESDTALRLTASILVVEARQATVLGDMAGDDLETMITASGEPADISEGASS